MGLDPAYGNTQVHGGCVESHKSLKKQNKFQTAGSSPRDSHPSLTLSRGVRDGWR